MRSIAAALSILLLLSACGAVRDSRFNPFNWFGGAEERRVAVVVEEAPADPRPLVAEVRNLAVERIPGGAIIRAMGLPPTQGYWDAELVRITPEGTAGTLVYEFRVFPPPAPARRSTERSREVVVGRYVSDQDLAGIRSITVIGAQNRRIVRR